MRLLAQLLQHILAGGDNAVAILAPGFGDTLECGGETRAAIAVVGREVCAADEGLQIRGQPHRHRPAASAGSGLHVGHVDAIDIRTLFAIYLDADEIVIQDRGDRFVLERLALHHMAPMAGGIADGEKDRFVVFPGFFERLGAPGTPIHWVMGMLEKVGALLLT